jgi:Zn-dependent peptidase ImmA (M78 family)
MLGRRANVGYRRVRRAVSQLALPRHFDLDTLVERVAGLRRRRIVLAALPMSNAGPCALWLATDSIDVICYEQATSPLHQRHMVLHEVGHLLLGHTGPHRPAALLATLAPHLSPTTLSIMLTRQHGTAEDADEAEAELFAYAVLRQAGARLDHRGGELTSRHLSLIEALEE